MRRAVYFILACALPLMATPVHAQEKGLSPAERRIWYHLSQGTEFLPYDFFMALKDFKTEGMLSDSFAEFGFLPDQDHPDKLPIGITRDETRDLRFAGVQMIGLNCAACHTAELRRNGKAQRIDGATALVNVNGFSTRVGQSIKGTLTDPREFLKFVHRVIRQKSRPLTLPLVSSLHEKLIAHFEDLVSDDERILKRVQTMLDERFQEKPVIDIDRVIAPRQAIEGILAQQKLKALDEAEEALKAPAGELLKEVIALDPRPAALRLLGLSHRSILRSTIGEIVIIHRLLRARFETFKNQEDRVKTKPGFGRVDAFGTARNKLFPEHAQDLDAPVRFPFIWEIGTLDWFHWDGNTRSATERNVGEALGVGVIVDPATGESTIRMDNLLRLEALAAKLQPPKWDVDVLGPIDAAKVAAGAKLFKKRCATCHDILKDDGKIEDKIVGIDKLKTDGLRVENIRRPVGAEEFFDAISPRLKKVIEAAEHDPGDLKDNQWRPSQQRGPLALGYPNRQLRAAWASPPYLHNGSVPNMYELLLPADERSKTFRLGSRVYDTEKLGYLEDAASSFEFDTSLKGNSNAGHDFNNAQFTKDERFELIEYLKTR